MEVSDNLNALMRRLNINQEALARAAGVSQSAVSQWIKGTKKPGKRSLDKIYKAFGLEPNDLLSESRGLASSSSPRLAVASSPSRLVPVRRLGSVHAGGPTDEGEADEEVLMPSHVVERHPLGFALLVVGDCMDRVIPEGATVLVDPAAEARDGSIVVARVEEAGECVMRRLRRGNTSAILVSESFSAHEDLTFSDGQTVAIEGVVVWMQRDLEGSAP